MAKYKLLAQDATTGQLKYPESQWLNVKDFGTFTTASSTLTAFNAAISAGLAAGGQTVYAPAGTYEIDDVLVIPGGVTLVGDGEDKTIIYSQANARILNLVEGSGAYITLGPKIRNLQVKGVKTAGTNQIGIAADDDLYMAFTEVSNVRVVTCGGHGLYVGNTFSSRFVNIWSSDHNGYPFLFNCENMPGNHFESLYAGDLNTGFLTGFRVRRGNVTLITCNGINNNSGDSWWATVGEKSGTDGAVVNRTAFLELHNCNIESSKAGGIQLYNNSIVNFVGRNYFVGDGTASGTYKPLKYEIDSAIYPTTFIKGSIPDSTVFANSENEDIDGTVSINGTTTVTGTDTTFNTSLVVGQLIRVNSEIRKISAIANALSLTVDSAFTGTASDLTLAKYYFAENEVVHANDLPPLMTCGQGLKPTQGTYHYGYYNSTNSRVEALYRADAFLNRTTVTSTTTFVNPGVRYYELKHTSPITLTIPWAGWYDTPELVIIKDVSGSAGTNNVTVATGVGGTINGSSSFTINKNGQSIGLVPNGNSSVLDWRIVFNYEISPDVINVKAFGAKGDNSANDTTPISNAVSAAYALKKPLYFPSGTYLTDTLIIPTNSLIIYGDGEGKSVLKSRDSSKAVIDIDTTSVVIHSITIRDLSIECAGTGSNNHGIYVHGTNEPSNLTVRNVRITNCTGSAIYSTNSLFCILFESVDISMLSGGSHAIDVTGSSDCTFMRCYVHTVGTSKAAYRVRSGTPVFIGCNGIDSGTTCLWGLFGNKTAEDGSDSYVRATFIGTNIEDFTSTGVRFKTGSTGTFIGSSILAPSSGTVKAIEFDFVDSNLAGIFDSGSSVGTKGASWANSNAIHSSGLPFIQIGNKEFSTYYDTNVGASTSFPGITGTLIAGSTDYALTFDGFTRFKNPARIDEVSAPATPPSNSVYLYSKDVSGTSGLFIKNDAGTEAQLGSGGSGDMVLASVQTVTGAKTFGTPGGAVGKLIIAGSSSGSTILDATPAAGSGTVTLPTSGTLYGTATGSISSSQLLTSLSDKTGTGVNVFATSPTLVTPVLGVASATSLATSAATPLILTNGQAVNIAVTSQTTGATTLTIPNFASVSDTFAFTTLAQTLSNKTFVAPALGTPASGNLSNCTGTASGLTAGTVTTNANLTGDVTSVGNTTTIGSNKVTLGMLATLAANSVIGNSTGSTATPTAVSMLSTATASSIALRDSNANLLANSFIDGFATTVTAAGTTTLTVGSKKIQEFTGSTTQTVTLPVVSTLSLGQSFTIINNSLGAVTVNSSGGNLVQSIPANSSATIICVLTSGTSASSWDSSGVGSAYGPETLSVTDLTTYTATSGTGTTAIRATMTGLVTADILGWDGSNWVNAINQPEWSNITSATNTMSINNGTFGTSITQSIGLWALNWTGNTTTSSLFKLSSNNTSATGYILDVVADSTSSSMKPFRLQARQADVLTTDNAGNLTLSPRTQTASPGTAFTVTSAAHSGYTGGAEIVDINFNNARTINRSAGAVSIDRSVRFRGRTLAFASSSTVSDAINVDVETITAGSNATITRSTGLRIKPSAATHHGLWVDGTVSYTGDAAAFGLSGVKIARFVGVNGSMNTTIYDNSALSNTATEGFLYISRMDSSSNPSGTPTATSYQGSSPIVLQNDSSNGRYRFWSYLNSGWRKLGDSIKEEKTWLPTAGVNGTTVGTIWDLPSTSPAVAVAVNGTNIHKGVLQFAHTGGSLSAQTTLYLPSDFTGNIDANIIWYSAGTSGNCKWSLATAFTACDATATDDPSFNTASTVTTAVPGTANRIQTSTITSVTATGSGANKLMHLKISRDGSDGSDTLESAVNLVGVEITIRRTI